MISNLKEFLDEKVELYNNKWFIEDDPISIPHQFTKKGDIEIAGLISSILAWGNRKAIIKAGNEIIKRLDSSPFDFIVNHKESDLKTLQRLKYRTFNDSDLIDLISGLQYIYKNCGGLENQFSNQINIKEGLINFRENLMHSAHMPRYEKHIANVLKGSAAKRLNMYLRWMVRKDDKGVDFGIWQNISSSSLMLPIDLHSGRVARKLGLLKRAQNDWKAVEEVSANLRNLDPIDPVKYDFALFGLGIYEEF